MASSTMPCPRHERSEQRDSMASSTMPRLLLLLALVSLFPSTDAIITSDSGLLPCSESEHCTDSPFVPLLRYGKYCGIGYTGCPGEAPCDNLDVCCQTHDKCIGDDLSNYFNVTCNQNLQDCLAAYRESGDPQFPGNTCDINEHDQVGNGDCCAPREALNVNDNFTSDLEALQHYGFNVPMVLNGTM